MVHDPTSGAPRPTGGPAPSDPSARPSSAASDARAAGPAFRALLEQLEEKARMLQDDAAGVRDAERLAGAVDTARASLEDALSLSDRLLESYRQSVQQAKGGGEPEERS